MRRHMVHRDLVPPARVEVFKAIQRVEAAVQARRSRASPQSDANATRGKRLFLEAPPRGQADGARTDEELWRGDGSEEGVAGAERMWKKVIRPSVCGNRLQQCPWPVSRARLLQNNGRCRGGNQNPVLAADLKDACGRVIINAVV